MIRSRSLRRRALLGAGRRREVAARAGEFETFLFVRGLDNVLAHLKKAGEAVDGAGHPQPSRARERGRHHGGGVLVQRMVEARVRASCRR